MYIITGVPGAGKSTVINSFLKNNQDWKIINYGTLMYEIARDFGVKDRDEMRKIDVETQKKIQREVGRKLKEEGKERKVILDTHAAIKTNKGYLPGLPEEIIKEFNVDGIILITGNAKEILARRNRDKSRRRDEESIEDVETHELVNISMCSTYSILKACPFSIIRNKDGRLDESVKNLERILVE